MFEEEQPNYQYYILQYALDDYYIGIMDTNKLDENEYAFELLQALNIVRIDNNYVITSLNFGLGDNNHIVYVNKEKVISIFTPTDEIIQTYNENITNNENQNGDFSTFYEMGNIQ